LPTITSPSGNNSSENNYRLLQQSKASSKLNLLKTSDSGLAFSNPSCDPLTADTPPSPSILTSTSSSASSPPTPTHANHQLDFDNLRLKHDKLLKENAEAVRKFKLLEQIHLDAVNEFDKQQSLMYGQLDELTQNLRACESANKKLLKGDELAKYKETCRQQSAEIENLNKKIEGLNFNLKNVCIVF